MAFDLELDLPHQVMNKMGQTSLQAGCMRTASGHVKEGASAVCGPQRQAAEATAQTRAQALGVSGRPWERPLDHAPSPAGP